jgi:hypothetical protein
MVLEIMRRKEHAKSKDNISLFSPMNWTIYEHEHEHF